MTPRQILERGLHKYAQQPAGAPKAPATPAATPPAPGGDLKATFSARTGGLRDQLHARADAMRQRMGVPANPGLNAMTQQLHAAHPGARQVSGTFQQGQLVSSQAGGQPPTLPPRRDPPTIGPPNAQQLYSDAKILGQNEDLLRQQDTRARQKVINLGGMMDSADPGGLRTSPLPPAGTGEQLTNADHVRAFMAAVPGTKFRPLPDGSMALDVSQPTYSDTSNQTSSAAQQTQPVAQTTQQTVAPQPPAPAQQPPAPAPQPTATAQPQPQTSGPAGASAQPTEKPQLDIQTTTAQLGDKDPAVKAEGEKAVASHVQQTATPEQVAQAEEHIKNPNSEAGQLSAGEFVKQMAGGDASKTQDANFFGQAMGMWDSIGPIGQAAFMVGVPAALIGLLSGDGLMGILGGLGIGALGIGAGAMGLMGDKTRAGMGQLMNSAYGAFTGQAVPQSLDAFGEKGQQETMGAVRAAMDAKGEDGRPVGWAAGQKAIADRMAQADALLGLPRELAITSVMGMGAKTPAEASQLLDQVAAQRQEASNPEYLRTKARETVLDTLRKNPNYEQLQQMLAGRADYNGDTSKRTWTQFAREQAALSSFSDPQYRQFLGPDNALPAGTTIEDFADSMLQNAYGAYPGEKGASMNVAQYLSKKYLVTKAARCWAGYEPVPGAKAYSRGSCRPVGSKKTQKEMKSGKERHHETTKQGCAQG